MPFEAWPAVFTWSPDLRLYRCTTLIFQRFAYVSRTFRVRFEAVRPLVWLCCCYRPLRPLLCTGSVFVFLISPYSSSNIVLSPRYTAPPHALDHTAEGSLGPVKVQLLQGQPDRVHAVVHAELSSDQKGGGSKGDGEGRSGKRRAGCSVSRYSWSRQPRDAPDASRFCKGNALFSFCGVRGSFGRGPSSRRRLGEREAGRPRQRLAHARVREWF